MKTIKPQLRLFVMVVLAVVCLGGASVTKAAYITNTANFGVSHPSAEAESGILLSVVSTSVTNQSLLSLGLFDPSFGTLNSVTLVLETSGSAFTGTVAGVGIGIAGSASITSSVMVAESMPNVAFGGSAFAFTNLPDLLTLPGDGVVLSSGASLSLSNSYSLLPELNDFTGVGSFDLNLSVADFYRATLLVGLGNVSASGAGTGSPSWEGFATVVYDFTPAHVPEPSTLMLLVGGVSVLVGAVRLKRRH